MLVAREKTAQVANALTVRKPGAAEATFAIATITFLGHFVFFPLFGLYEDDYILTLPTMSWSWHDFLRALSDAWMHPVFARPLNFFLRGIIFFFTVRHGHLAAGFLVSWALVAGNGVLLYTLIRRILSHPAALVGSLIFVLFPLDTSRQILMVQTDLLLGIFLLLLCFHFYLRGRYFVAYGVLTISLLNLEAFFLPFLVAPILVAGRQGMGSSKGFFRKLFTHAAILGILFGCYVLGRLVLGEERAREVSSKAGDTAARMARLAVEGPWHGIEALILRPIDGAIHSNSLLLPFALLAAVVTPWALTRKTKRTDAEIRVSSDINSAQGGERRAWAYVLVSGLLAWPLGYVLWIPNDYFPPVIGIGRMSGEHAAAAIAAGLATAGFAEWVVSTPISPKRFLALAFSCYCGALVSFGVHIQLSEYVAYWAETKRFWSVLLDQIRDVQDGDVVLIEQSSDNRVMPTTQGFPMWDEESYFPLVLPYFVDFPANWKHPPRVYGIWPQVPFHDDGEARKLHTPAWAVGIWPTIRSGNFIYLRAADGRLERVNHPVEIRGKIFDPKSGPLKNMPPLKNSKIYVNLTSEPTSKDWFTLRNAKSYPN
jgi:hypothetical protein